VHRSSLQLGPVTPAREASGRNGQESGDGDEEEDEDDGAGDGEEEGGGKDDSEGDVGAVAGGGSSGRAERTLAGGAAGLTGAGAGVTSARGGRLSCIDHLFYTPGALTLQ
jgi:hypothetical protein